MYKYDYLVSILEIYHYSVNKMEKLDSKIVALNNSKYLVYLKRVNVKAGKKGEGRQVLRAFVRKVKDNGGDITKKDILPNKEDKVFYNILSENLVFYNLEKYVEGLTSSSKVFELKPNSFEAFKSH